MLTVEEAQAQILAQISTLPDEEVSLIEAAGRVLATDLVAPRDLPPFVNSSMDGYAVRAIDLSTASGANPIALRLVGEAAAGKIFAGEVGVGETVRIFTGAPLPAGADAVLQQELTSPGADATTISMNATLELGTNVRGVGSDLRAGTHIVAGGSRLNASTLAVIAAAGFASVRVTRRPRVAIVSTGDELVEPGQSLAPGQIYNSNAAMLVAAVSEAGAEPWLLPTAHDTHEDIRATFAQAREADLVLTSGGVSVGDYDLVRAVLSEMGQIGFWRVNVRPGKPLAFGLLETTPLIGLPGNPVSAAVTFELFARPAILQMLGSHAITRSSLSVRLGEAIERGDRRHYVRARLRFEDGGVIAVPTGDQGSHRISSTLDADALVIIPEGTGSMEAGEIANALLLR